MIGFFLFLLFCGLLDLEQQLNEKNDEPQNIV